ncbi:Ig-like domain-containing protein, partial [Myxococcota bacterium]|nr:Ig-like domain-containing protein [Myxococcota bacterium]
MTNRKTPIKLLLLLSMFIFISACDDDSNESNTDITSPTVLSVNPADLGTSVAINTQIAATFSEEMDPATITTTSFTLDAGADSVAGTVEFTGTTATFTPEQDLDGDTLYTARITTSAMDLAGNALEATYVWTFTTGLISDIIAPTVTSELPADLAVGLPTNVLVSATFSEDMDPATLTTASFTVSGSNSVT